MANDNPNLSNPNDIIDVALLDYFRGKSDDKYASKEGVYTKSEVDQMIDEVDRKYSVTVAEHTVVFTGEPVTVVGHKVVLL